VSVPFRPYYVGQTLTGEVLEISNRAAKFKSCCKASKFAFLTTNFNQFIRKLTPPDGRGANFVFFLKKSFHA